MSSCAIGLVTEADEMLMRIRRLLCTLPHDSALEWRSITGALPDRNLILLSLVNSYIYPMGFSELEKSIAKSAPSRRGKENLSRYFVYEAGIGDRRCLPGAGKRAALLNVALLCETINPWQRQ